MLGQLGGDVVHVDELVVHLDGARDAVTTVVPPTTTPTVEPLYDVVLFIPADTESKDLAKQIVTAGATLVAAVAAFYFGASTVAQAHRNATANAAAQAQTIKEGEHDHRRTHHRRGGRGGDPDRHEQLPRRALRTDARRRPLGVRQRSTGT